MNAFLILAGRVVLVPHGEQNLNLVTTEDCATDVESERSTERESVIPRNHELRHRLEVFLHSRPHIYVVCLKFLTDCISLFEFLLFSSNRAQFSKYP